MGVATALDLAELPDFDLRAVGLNVVQLRKLRATVDSILSISAASPEQLGGGGGLEEAEDTFNAVMQRSQTIMGSGGGGGGGGGGGEEYDMENDGDTDHGLSAADNDGETILFPPGPLGLKVSSVRALPMPPPHAPALPLPARRCGAPR